MVIGPLLFLLALCLSVEHTDAQEESYETLLEVIYGTLTEIQLEVKKEDRFREVAQSLRINSKMEEINRRINEIFPSSETDNLNIDSRGRTGNLEKSIRDIQHSFSQLEKKINKFEEEERNFTDEINSKIQKLSNIISTMHDYHKNMQNHFRPSDPQGVERSGYGIDMNQFILENLEETERKFKDGLRILREDVKRNLDYVKSFVPSTTRCSRSNGGVGSMDAAESVPVGQTVRNPRFYGRNMKANIQNLENSLALTGKEIHDEIENNLESIDINLSEISNYLSTCERPNRGNAESSRQEPDELTVPEQRVSHTVCTNASHILIPKNCWELKRGGANCDGPYIIYPRGMKAVRVFCDMANGGWTVILRRGAYGILRHSFEKNWESYKMGFGDVNGEYWIGNENLQLLSEQESLELKVDLTARDGTSTSLTYSRFSIGSEGSNYRLRLGSPVPGPNSKVANYFRHHSSHPFSTYDRNNRRGNCPNMPARGGWWHLCNTPYARLTEPDMSWYAWNTDIQNAVMKIRPTTPL